MVKTKHRIVGVFLSVCVLLLCMAGMPIKAGAVTNYFDNSKTYTYAQVISKAKEIAADYSKSFSCIFLPNSNANAPILGITTISNNSANYIPNPNYSGSEDNSYGSISVSKWKYLGDSSYGPVFCHVASSTPTPATYTVTWVNWDGKPLETDKNVSKGTTPQYNGKTPTRPSKDGKTYTFKG